MKLQKICIIINNMESNLTKREKEILKLASQGYSNKKIADELCISYHTVKFHLENIYRKLNIHNKVEATRIAMQSKTAY